MTEPSGSPALHPLHPDSALILRRRATPRAAAPAAKGLRASGEPASATATEPEPLWGIALSGGGIRSATLALGVLQAVAAAPRAGTAAPSATHPAPGALYRHSLLSRFEALSTVSGGGYIGAFLCSLFLPGRLREGARTPELAADDAVKVLCNEPPGRLRIGQAPSDDTLPQAPLAWLRDNGRYLAPSGGGDMAYAFTTVLRNWIAVHYVIGTVLLAAFAALALLVAGCSFLRAHDATHLFYAIRKLQAGAPWHQSLWWSPLAWPPALVLMVWVLPSGLSYWLAQPEAGSRRNRTFNKAVAGLFFVAVLFFGAAAARVMVTDAQVPGTLLALAERVVADALWRGANLLLVLALAFYGWNVRHSVSKEVEGIRVRATRQLSRGLVFTGVLVLLAIIDTAARSLYVAMTIGQGAVAGVLTPAGLAGALVWFVRWASRSADEKSLPPWLRRLPWTVLAGVGGLGILMVVAVAWSLTVLALQWLGQPPSADAVRSGQQWPLLVVILALTLAMGWLVGRFPSFINLSSLQSFYSARLTRAYLGASNGARFRSEDRRNWSVADPQVSDQVELGAFAQPDAGGHPRLTTWAPLHLINVTLNHTVDPGEQIVQRDRKGKPLLVTPLGFTVDGEAFQPFETEITEVELRRPLTLGQWIGTSGAAFSTGIGRETSLGVSLLLGAANVRLGTWWESGLGRPMGPGWLARTADRLFRTQNYLLQEFTAKFHGLGRPWQYLSDGGHFENTGLYELLRPERQLRLALACDNGADPQFLFTDLANLIRLVRIDMQVELEVDASVAGDHLLAPWFGVPEDFQPERQAQRGPGDSPPHQPVAVLLRATPAGRSEPSAWVVLLKPRVRADSAADVREYAARHPAFPQEPTADQFFDEAQWESYRKLGRDNAAHVLQPAVLRALERHMAKGRAPARSPLGG